MKERIRKKKQHKIIALPFSLAVVVPDGPVDLYGIHKTTMENIMHHSGQHLSLLQAFNWICILLLCLLFFLSAFHSRSLFVFFFLFLFLIMFEKCIMHIYGLTQSFLLQFFKKKKIAVFVFFKSEKKNKKLIPKWFLKICFPRIEENNCFGARGKKTVFVELQIMCRINNCNIFFFLHCLQFLSAFIIVFPVERCQVRVSKTPKIIIFQLKTLHTQQTDAGFLINCYSNWLKIHRCIAHTQKTKQKKQQQQQLQTINWWYEAVYAAFNKTTTRKITFLFSLIRIC